MKTKRIVIFLLIATMLMSTALAFSSCGKSSYENETFSFNVKKGSDGSKSLSLEEIVDKEATEIVIPATFEDIPVDTVLNTAFDGCANLKKITFSENIKYINHAKNNAFASCQNLEVIVFDCKNFVTYNSNNEPMELQINNGSANGVTLMIGADAGAFGDIFVGSSNLTHIVWDKAWFEAGNHGCFDDCAKLDQITFNGTKAEWCQYNGVNPTMCYSYMILGDKTDAYMEQEITVSCTDGDIIYSSGKPSEN